MSDQNIRQRAEDHYYLALDLFADGQHEQAISEYNKCVDIDPSFTEAMHGLSRAYQEVGKFDEAIAVSSRIVEVDPDDVLAHTSLSILYQRKGMVPEAEA